MTHVCCALSSNLIHFVSPGQETGRAVSLKTDLIYKENSNQIQTIIVHIKRNIFIGARITLMVEVAGTIAILIANALHDKHVWSR